MHHSPCLSIIELGLKNQLLISRCLDLGLAEQAQMLRHIDDRLIWQLKAEDRLSEEEQRAQGFTHYIWRTQGDEKVRPEHAANDGQVFAWDDPPPTGHPGADYGCRCWAQPLDGAEPVYPLESIAGALGTRAGYAILREILRRVGGAGLLETIEEKPKEILNPDGKPIGRQGDKPKVREMEGGEKGARELYEKLSKGGTPDTPAGYPGEGTKLPNGDWVGHRPTSKSGPPTVDVHVEGVPFDKIKFP